MIQFSYSNEFDNPMLVCNSIQAFGSRYAMRNRRWVPTTRVSRACHAACLLSLLAIAPGAAWSQTALVNVTSCAEKSFPSTCTIPATGSGNLIVVGFQMAAGSNTATTVQSITDSVGNVYAEAGAARSIDTAIGTVVDIWYAGNSVPGATSVSISPSAGVSAGAVIWEFSGVDRTAPLDRVSVLNSQTSTTTISGAPVSITSAVEVIVSIAEVAHTITGITSPNPFVNDSTVMSNGWAHLLTSAAGTYSSQWTQNTTGSYASSTASFKAAAAAGGGGGGTTTSACDLNGDLAVNVVDVQLATDMYLGLRPCTANIAGSGVCTASVVDQVKTAALTGVCTTVPGGSHSVTLNWTASTTPGVSYNVYRSATSGGPYTKLNSSLVAGTTYTDTTVTAGQTYYYVAAAVDSSSTESSKSNQASAVIPSP